MSPTGIACLDDLCRAPLASVFAAARSKNLRISLSLTDGFCPAPVRDPSLQTALELALVRAAQLAERGGEVRLDAAVDRHNGAVMLMISASPTSGVVEGWNLSRARDMLAPHGGSLAVESDGSGGIIRLCIGTPLAATGVAADRERRARPH